MTRSIESAEISARCRHLALACALLGTLLIFGCGGDHESDVPNASPSEETTSSSDDSIRSVVDAYVRERTEEGAPYYIDSYAAQFDGIEEVVPRPDGAAVCRARFTAGADVFLLEFWLRKEIGSYIITRVVLESLNAEPVGRTLYSRDSLVL